MARPLRAGAATHAPRKAQRNPRDASADEKFGRMLFTVAATL
jgi:hypothetical protein